ncbi:MAG: methylmalonyl-CoA mutase, partial [Chloroflexi bacterium]|nr:methylmalonyl-CoA mutase [Chloroflexota bacterium]
AGRRMWARIMKDRSKARKPESMRLRFHPQTLGSALMRQDPQNNIARGTLQALAAVLGGTQSLHVSGFDEAFDIPSEEAMRMSLATQLILSHESGVTNTVDPMAGSYFMESMTNNIEEAAWEYISKIEAFGEGQYPLKSGMLHAIDTGYIELEIARSAYEYQLKIESGDQVVVGLNQYQSESNQKLELFEFDPEEEEWQKGRLAETRGGRSPADVKSALSSLKQSAQDDKNLMPSVLEAVGALATEGEILDTMRDVYGEYVDPGVF